MFSVGLFSRPQVDGRRAAALGGDLVADLLAFVETVQSRALDRADMHEHILAAVARLDEPEALSGVEPLYRTSRHLSLLGSLTSIRHMKHARTARSFATVRDNSKNLGFSAWG